MGKNRPPPPSENPGCAPVWADLDPVDLCVDELRVPVSPLTPKTVLPWDHLLGHPPGPASSLGQTAGIWWILRVLNGPLTDLLTVTDGIRYGPSRILLEDGPCQLCEQGWKPSLLSAVTPSARLPVCPSARLPVCPPDQPAGGVARLLSQHATHAGACRHAGGTARLIK